MIEKQVYFADTYALIELVGGNPNYQGYTQHILITTIFNLVELYYSFLKDYGPEIAQRYFKAYKKNIISISDQSIEVGMLFKLQHKKEKLSYIDCLGYTLALEMNIKFLTGDEKFEHKDKVEYVR